MGGGGDDLVCFTGEGVMYILVFCSLSLTNDGGRQDFFRGLMGPPEL